MYRMRQRGVIRDECYPSKIAENRPLLATRLTWENHEAESGETANRGSDNDNRVAKFNEQLRGGHAGRNDGDE